MYATCVFKDCCECALREIETTDLSEHVCHGGIDTSLKFLPPCATCYERLFPAEQDLQNFELDTFFDLPPSPSVEDDFMDLDSTFIWGESDSVLLQNVMEDIKEVQDRWPPVSLPIEDTRQVENDAGQVCTFRFYKPFQRKIDDNEMTDFKSFLSMIF